MLGFICCYFINIYIFSWLLIFNSDYLGSDMEEPDIRQQKLDNQVKSKIFWRRLHIIAHVEVSYQWIEFMNMVFSH